MLQIILCRRVCHNKCDEYVTSNDLTTVYAVSGNGEANMSEALASALSTDNINYSTVSLMNGEGGGSG